jgi:3-hydroxyacyl-CoA dehydrogenase
MTGNPVVHLQRVDHVVVLSIDNPPVNALSVAVRQAFLSHLTLMAETTGVTALVLACAGKSFSAGADLAELGDAPADPSMGAVMRAIESAGYLIVAAIQGSALGGGLELALLADYRIATPDAQFGLPEINLGLLPGGGATQRLPRLIGVQPAIELMRSGKPIGSAKALELGLIDEVAAGDLLQAAIALACTQADKPQRRRPGLQPPAEARDIDFPAQRRQAVQSFPSVEAAAYAVDAVEASTRLPLAEGLAVEAALFRQARGSAGSLALRHLFAAERLVGKIPGLERTLPRQVARVAVIGAGTMGIGVSIAVLDAGYELQLIEATAAALERGVASIRGTYAALVRRGRLENSQMHQRLSNLCASVDLQTAAGSDLAIECIFEDLEAKKTLFAELGALLPSHAVLATNTSALDVDAIAQASGRSADVVGMHFFSPANIMRLVEVVRAADTAPDALATALAVTRRMRKIGVVCGVCDGFIGNRMIGGYLREAGLLLLEGAAPAHIDAALRDFGMAMGPHAMGDLAGLDIQAAGRARRRTEGKIPADPRYGAVGDALVAAGRLGLKSGAGIYAYPNGGRDPTPDPWVATLIEAEARRLGIIQRSFTADEIVMRCLLPVVNEGARVLAEGIALGAADIDVVYVNGYGFPRSKGGPMFWADQMGLAKLLTQIEQFGAGCRYGYWQPAPLLLECIRSGQRLGDLARA